MGNWDVLLWVLVQYSVVSIVIERALYLVFEWSAFKKGHALLKSLVGDWADIRPLISGAVGVYIAFLIKADMLRAVFEREEVTQVGMIVTGLFIAGGSKAVYETFKRLRQLKDAQNDAKIVKAKNGN